MWSHDDFRSDLPSKQSYRIICQSLFILMKYTTWSDSERLDYCQGLTTIRTLSQSWLAWLNLRCSHLKLNIWIIVLSKSECVRVAAPAVECWKDQAHSCHLSLHDSMARKYFAYATYQAISHNLHIWVASKLPYWMVITLSILFDYCW